MYTYAVWDISQRRLVTTLDEIFSSFLLTGNFPIPKWSPDGSRFVFQGFNPTADPVNIELYEVNRDGQTKQLTQLAPAAYVWEPSFSWSPDGRYIAMFLGSQLGAPYEKARVAVLDTLTLNVIDYCVSVTFLGDGYGGGPLVPIWSPDGLQFVITDRYEKDHRRVILVDIENNSAAKIADDMEPVGWMVAP
jgi:Tol biopolymer transport system component